MKALHDYDLTIAGLMLESPFGSMPETVKARFRNMGIPGFPFAHLMVFWGGVQHGFNGFSHNPSVYAHSISVPILVLYGKQDQKVTKGEIDQIMQGLGGNKTLALFENAGHDNFLKKAPDKWKGKVEKFLNSL